MNSDSISAADNSLLDNEDDVELEKYLTDEKKSSVKYKFYNKFINITWLKLKIEFKDEFYEKLLTVLSMRVEIFDDYKLHTNLYCIRRKN